MSADTASLRIVAPASGSPSAPAAAAGLGPSILMVVGSCVSLQFGSAFATMIFPALGPWGTTALRLSIAALVLLAVCRPNLRAWTRSQWAAVLCFGAALAGMNGFFYAAIARIPIGIAVCIEFLGPLALAAVLSRRWKDTVWTGLALAGIGLFFVDDLVGDQPLDRLGVLCVLVAAGFWALYILTSERVGRLVPGTGGLAGALAVGAVLMLPFGAQTVPPIVAQPGLLVPALATAALASLIPYSLEFAALRRLPKPVFGVLLSLEPVVASFAGLLLLGQGITALGACAIALVVLASAGSTLSARRRR